MVSIMSNEPNISMIESVLAAAGSGAFTRAVSQPLDVVKIRFQLQTEPIKQGSKYSSIFQAMALIVKEEGITTLWSGHIPAQLLSISYGVFQFSMFEFLTQTSQRNMEIFDAYHHRINFTNGTLAAAFATILSYPFDTVRTRLIAEQKTKKVYKGVVDAFITIIQREGFLALFKGVIPTLGQIAPQTGVLFTVYKLLTTKVFNKIEMFQRDSHVAATNSFSKKSTLLANLIAGSSAGFVAYTVVYPFDLVKKRLQIQGFQKYRKGFGRQIYCNGVLHCVRLTIVKEGFTSLYKGFGPSVLKAAIVTALYFGIYDEIKHFFTKV